jgi:hypothetical protein
MTPGHYVTLRREAAGLSLADAQRRLDGAIVAWSRHKPEPVPADLPGLRDYEADQAFAGVRVLTLLSLYVFPIDPTVYRTLAIGGAPDICRLCGCSQHDACLLGERTCAWAAPDRCDSPTCTTRHLKEMRRAS